MKIIYTIILLIISAISINAQTKESADLNSIVDYVTCVCVNDALPDNKKINCENDQLTLSAIPATEKSTIALFNEFQKLKDKTNISDNLHFFTEEVFNDQKKYSKIYAFSERRKGSKIDDLKSKIKIFINKETSKKEENLNSDQPTTELGDSENAAIENQDSLSDVDTEIRNNTIPPAVSTFYIFNFWTYFSIGLSILSIVLVFILNKIKTKLNRYCQENHKLKSQKKEQPSYKQIIFSDRERSTERIIKDLEEKNKILSAEIQKNKQEQFLNNTMKNSFPEGNNEIELSVPPKPVQEEFYMATPDQNTFDLSSLSQTFKPTQTLYKFTVDAYIKSKATFVFFSDEIGIKDAVNYPHRYLETVCDPQNALNQNAKSIITINPGIAEKRNDKWLVVTKAKIKYE